VSVVGFQWWDCPGKRKKAGVCRCVANFSSRVSIGSASSFNVLPRYPCYATPSCCPWVEVALRMVGGGTEGDDVAWWLLSIESEKANECVVAVIDTVMVRLPIAAAKRAKHRSIVTKTAALRGEAILSIPGSKVHQNISNGIERVLLSLQGCSRFEVATNKTDHCRGLDKSAKDVGNQNRTKETDLQPVLPASRCSSRHFNPCHID
jgi:hypothetical protein